MFPEYMPKEAIPAARAAEIVQQLEAVRLIAQDTIAGKVPTEYESTSFHECSHAVAAVALGIPFEYVEMNVYQHSAARSDDEGGLHLMPEWMVVLKDGDPQNRVDREKLERLAIVAIAGEVCQAVLDVHAK
jgi:hypothetical protein